MFRFLSGVKVASVGAVLIAACMIRPTIAQTQVELKDLGGRTMEAAAIKSMVFQGIMNPVSPGKFAPEATVKRADFAIAMQRLFSLPQPAEAIKFSDVRPGDANYKAAEAVAPYMDKRVPVEGAVGSKFEPDRSLNRAQWAVTVVRILVDQKKLELLNDADTDKVLSTVPDAKDLSKRARPYFATAIKADILECCYGNVIVPDQMPSRADVAEMLYNIQQHFQIPAIGM